MAGYSAWNEESARSIIAGLAHFIAGCRQSAVAHRIGGAGGEGGYSEENE